MRPIDADKITFDYSGLAHIPPNDCVAIAKYFADQIKAMPTIAPPPNDPLTLEEFREMDGEPVYDRMGYEWFIVAEVTDDEVIMTDGTVFDINEDSPNTVDRRFCRRKPEEETV